MAEQRYTLEETVSGLLKFRGDGPTAAGAALALQLARAVTPVVVWSNPTPALSLPTTACEFLFDWLPPTAQPLASPVVCLPSDFSTHLAAGWGRQAMVVLFSRRPLPELVGLLRQACRVGAPGATPTAVRGVYMPNPLTQMLQQTACAEFQPLLAAVDAFYLDTDPQAAFVGFSSRPFAAVLRSFGWVEEDR